MASITYTFSLRDNIDNQNVTGSVILPFYPPTASPLSSSIEEGTYKVQTDSTTFTGWRQDYKSYTYTIRGYTITLQQENLWRQTKSVFYIVNRPKNYNNPIDQDIDKPTFQDYIYGLNLDTGAELEVLQRVLDIVNKEDRRSNDQTESQLLGLTVPDEVLKWTLLSSVEATKVRQNIQGDSYGFRIKTPGYQDLTFFAESVTGARLIPDSQGVIDLGVYKLMRIEADSQKESTDLQKVDSKTILTNAPSSEKAKGTNKLSQILQSRTTVIKNVLITALVAQITQFGISKIRDIIEKKVSLDKLPKVCPTPAKLAQLIAIRNKYADQLNKFYSNISRLSTALTGSNKVAQAISTALTVATTARQAANIALAFIPVTPGAAPSAINVLKDLEDTIKPRIEKVLKTVGILTSTVAFITAVLLIVIELLKLLDNLILLCAQEQGIPYEAISNQLTALNPGLTNSLQNSTPTIDNSYKGFKFELMLDTTNSTKYPKRYAVARDKFGVILLKSDSSFTPNPELLINELKFIIDRDNLSAE